MKSARCSELWHTHTYFYYVAVLLCVGTFFLQGVILVHAESIEVFDVTISINDSSIVAITEKITYVFTEDRHGISRCIPTLHHEKAASFLRERYIDIDIQSISLDGVAVPFSTKHVSGDVCFKIGDPTNTITGTHVYEIKYTVGGGMSYSEYAGIEFYWNATGNEWEIPIKKAEIRVTSPQSILLRERACYRGEVGKNGSCDTRNDTGGAVFSGTLLAPGEGITIAQAVDRSKIPYDIRERFKMVALLVFSIPILFGALSFGMYRYKTKFKTRNTVIPQYEPYPGVKPMYMGALFDGTLDPHDISAGILYLAEQGYIKIKKNEKKVLFFFEVDDYAIQCVKLSDAVLGDFEKDVLRLLFGEREAVVGMEVTMSMLKESLIKNYKSTMPLHVKVMGISMWTHTNTTTLVTVEKLKKDAQEKLIQDGFFEARGAAARLKSPAGISFIVGIVLLFIPYTNIQVGGCILIVLGFIFGMTVRRRTTKGYEALDHLKGFRDFLSVTETHRYIFHNAPEKNAEQFMQYLPYAIAFGVEKEWAKVFEGVTIPNPNWYEGGSDIATFNAIALTNSLGGFSTAFASTTASSSSASSGGGFSGGGSGGGGGGSW